MCNVSHKQFVNNLNVLYAIVLLHWYLLLLFSLTRFTPSISKAEKWSLFFLGLSCCKRCCMRNFQPPT